MTNKQKYCRDTNNMVAIISILPAAIVFTGIIFIGILKTENSLLNISLIAVGVSCLVFLYSCFPAFMFYIDRDLKNPYKYDDE